MMTLYLSLKIDVNILKLSAAFKRYIVSTNHPIGFFFLEKSIYLALGTIPLPLV